MLALPALAVRSAAAMLPDNAMVDAWAGSLSAVAALWQGQRGFFTPRAVSPFLLNDGSAGATSFYDTGALRTPLQRLVDFARITEEQQDRESAARGKGVYEGV